MNLWPQALVMTVMFVAAQADGAYSPARYRQGPVPFLPRLSAAVGPGQVVLEVAVSSTGEVAAVRPLRTTASFTAQTIEAVRQWRFVPAEARVEPHPWDTGQPKTRLVDSTVLVAAIFRPPAIHAPTVGEPVFDLATPSDESPFPVSTAMPPFPPGAYDPGVVLIEVLVDASGAVVDANVLSSAPPFDGAALDAARRWKFQPARIGGKPAASFVYILLGFPLPRG